ncbi:MAG: autotransporter outer membrane beta-barrel domain-containing protein [Akkermansia sp.]|nr:autotransporter outer membrane beta-barrel domain-containing protein [Akkermansia sp.]
MKKTLFIALLLNASVCATASDALRPQAIISIETGTSCNVSGFDTFKEVLQEEQKKSTLDDRTAVVKDGFGTLVLDVDLQMKAPLVCREGCTLIDGAFVHNNQPLDSPTLTIGGRQAELVLDNGAVYARSIYSGNSGYNTAIVIGGRDGDGTLTVKNGSLITTTQQFFLGFLSLETIDDNTGSHVCGTYSSMEGDTLYRDAYSREDLFSCENQGERIYRSTGTLNVDNATLFAGTSFSAGLCTINLTNGALVMDGVRDVGGAQYGNYGDTSYGATSINISGGSLWRSNNDVYASWYGKGTTHILVTGENSRFESLRNTFFGCYSDTTLTTLSVQNGGVAKIVDASMGVYGETTVSERPISDVTIDASGRYEGSSIVMWSSSVIENHGVLVLSDGVKNGTYRNDSIYSPADQTDWSTVAQNWPDDSAGTPLSTSDVEALLRISGGRFFNGSTGTVDVEEVYMDAGSLENDGSMSTGEQSLVGGTLINRGSITASGDVTNSGAELHLYGTLKTTGSFSGTGSTILHIDENTASDIVMITADTASSDDSYISVQLQLDQGQKMIGRHYDFFDNGGTLQTLGTNRVTALSGENDAAITWTTDGSGNVTLGGGILHILGTGATASGISGCTIAYWLSPETVEDVDAGDYTSTISAKDQETITDNGTQYISDGDSSENPSLKAIYTENVSTNHASTTIALLKKESDNAFSLQDTQGRILLMQEDTLHEGNGIDTSFIGFDSTDSGDTVTINNVTYQKEEVDIVRVTGNETLKDLTLNAGQRLDVVAGASLTIQNSVVNIGGTELKNFEDFSPDDSDTPVSLPEDIDLASRDSKLDGTIILDGGQLYGKQLTGGNTTGSITGSETTVIAMKDSKLGSSAPDAMRVALTNSSVSGTGTMNKVSMSGGSLTIGNSPGKMTIADSEFSDSTWSFYFITDATWNVTGANTTTNPDDGAFSQLVVGNGNSASGITVKIRYEDAAGVDKTKDDFEPVLGAGFSVKLIDNAQSLTLGGGNTVDASTLPTLQAGLLWDTTRLFSTGSLYVIHDMVADAGRIANTLVSAADTTVSFGRLARDHAKDARRSGVNAWVSGFGTYLNHSNAGGRTGFEYNTHGYAVGVDTELSKGLVTGVGFGQSFGKHKPNRGDAFYNAGEIDQDGLLAGIYASQTFDCRKSDDTVELDGYVAYGRYDNKSKRTCVINGTQANADWKEDTMAAAVSLTRRIKLPENAELTPYVGAEYRWANMKDAIERNRSAVRYEGTSYQNLSLSVGIGCNKTYSLTPTQKLTPYASLAYVGDVMRKDAKVTAHTPSGETVVDKSAPHGRSALQVRVGAVWQVTDSWSIHAGYTGEIRYGADDHSANVGVSYSF